MPAATAISVQLPPGKSWAVGVSGGADSVALLCLLHEMPGLCLHIVHLDHELRGAASSEDAKFVGELGARFGLPCHIARRSEIEPAMRKLPVNPSARYRAIRLALFRRVAAENRLCGVLLAHHADDVAETVLQRLLRGSGPAGLSPLSMDRIVGGLRIVRPLLQVRRGRLREFLQSRGQSWREDASNDSDAYLRNRLRRILACKPGLTEALLGLSADCEKLRDWIHQTAPELPAAVTVKMLCGLPEILARESARRYLTAAGAPAEDLTMEVLDRFIAMAADAATQSRQQFPGGITVRRRGGVVSVAKPDVR